MTYRRARFPLIALVLATSALTAGCTATIGEPTGTPGSTGGPKGPLANIPEVFVQGGEVQLAEHSNDGAVYTILKSFYISGRVEQTADASGTSIISFRQKKSMGPFNCHSGYCPWLLAGSLSSCTRVRQ